MSRPEHLAPPEIFYNEKEAKKYSVSSRMNQIQRVISERAIELLNLKPFSETGPQLLLDIGCGTGLSGEVIEDAGHGWIGMDISNAMLEIVANRFERQSERAKEDQRIKKENGEVEEDDDEEEMPPPKLGANSKFMTLKAAKNHKMDEDEDDDEDDDDDDDDEDEDEDDDDEDEGDDYEDGEEEEEEEELGAPAADVICQDMGGGLGFRGGVFDGAISISAVQWLCYANHKHHIPKLRLRAFFHSLYSCLKRGARAVLQFYPETPQQMELITTEALAVGFSGGVVVDYPNSAKAKKYYLVLMTGRTSSSSQTVKKPNSSGVSVAGSQMTVATAVSKYTMTLPKGLEGNGPEDEMGKYGKGTVGYSGREERTKKRGRKRVRDRKDRPMKKSRDWIKNKKQRQFKQGKEVKHDSRYTGRRRKGGF